MRGKPLAWGDGRPETGITPADAGKTGDRNSTSLAVTDHPRGCGENSRIEILLAKHGGSPPRMRGKHPPQLVWRRFPGITPADAGKTMQGSCDDAFGKGSPPRMRGKRQPPALLSSKDRITPADAGKTSMGFAAATAVGDHPRGCGENQTMTKFLKRKAGSPPRMRGKLVSSGQVSQAQRITPADAGKTEPDYDADVRQWDHPRGCGENSFYINIDNSFTGSPPRMRGKLSLLLCCHILSRITPADAGKTDKLSYSKLKDRDHPRGCGENNVILNMFPAKLGSPPRMRGKLSANMTTYRAYWDHPRGCGENHA